MEHYFEKNKIKIAALSLLLLLSIIRIYTEKKPYPTGDAIEYTLMTEAFYNHFTPEVKATDSESFKNTYTKSGKWENNEKAAGYDAVADFLREPNHKNLDYQYAFFVDKDGRKYSCHFWFYSLVNLPMRWICAIRPFNPLRVFYITNLLLVFFSCCVFFKTSRFKPIETAAFCFLFFYCTNYWYFCWSHPEVFCFCMVALGLWLFMHEKWYAGILLVSIAALQNQPLAILTVVLSLLVLMKNGFNLRNIAMLFLSSCLIFAPSLFYFYHYGTANLIGYQGALHGYYVTPTRVFGFFFDINQGMILALPLILLLYLFLYFRKLYRIKTAVTRWDLWLLPAAIAVACAASTINNWNHGQAVVNRYVTYGTAIILLHFFYLLMEIKVEKTRQIILALCLVTQLATVLYFQKITRFDWSTYQPKPLSNWVLGHCPSLYNPDPVIFYTRYRGEEMDPAQSPAYFMKKNGDITKFLVQRSYIHNLQLYGLSLQQTDSIGKTLSYSNGWAYITVSNKLKALLLPAAALRKIDDERRIAAQIKKIKETPVWYESVKKKAMDKGIPEEEALREDAAYTLHLVLAK